MAVSALAKKLKLKPGLRLAIINGPEGYLKELAPLPEGVEVVTEWKGDFDWIQIFAVDRAAFEAMRPRALAAMRPDSMLWISFPKGSSGIQTDLTRDQGWDSLRGADRKYVTLISVNQTWSAFALRTYRPGEQRQRMPWS